MRALRGIWPAVLLACFFLMPLNAVAQVEPEYDSRIVHVNDIWLTIHNDGNFGTWRDPERPRIGPDPRRDRQTLDIWWIPSLETPPGTQNDYLRTSYVEFGCLRGTDTLLPWLASFTPLKELSNVRHRDAYDPRAKAEQQFETHYSDTSEYVRRRWDYWRGQWYEPVGLDVRQTVYAWSTTFAKRFILFDYILKNVSDRPIDKGCLGLWVNPVIHNDAWPQPDFVEPQSLTGMIRTAPGVVPGLVDSMMMVWVASNDGDPIGGKFRRECPTSVIGFRILRAPPGGSLSYNWWGYVIENYGSRQEAIALEWGPRQRRNSPTYDGSIAAPYSARGLYRMMTNGEIDYDQVYSAFDYSEDGWYPPPKNRSHAWRMARGTTNGFLLSAGPFDPIAPGDSVAFTFAVIAGEKFHTNPDHYDLAMNPSNPQLYLNGLDFSDLILNARWADWVFDIPGYDTDGDGNRGLAHPFNCGPSGCDTVYYKGDGIADFRPPQPPTPPEFSLTTKPYAAILRWSGAIPETEVDPLSGRRDFEGYRVYTGRFNTDDQMSLIASWDIEDYARYALVPNTHRWEQVSHPLTISEWQEYFDNPSFHPDDYPVPSLERAYRDTVIDTVWNARGRIVSMTPRERYSHWGHYAGNRGNEYGEADQWQANMIQRVADTDTLVGSEVVSYGTYEITIDGLNPSVPLYFAVATFDFGNHEVRLPPLESSPSANVKYGEPLYSADVVVDSGLGVSVFPNPYKIRYDDAFGNPTTYYLEGYEGRGMHEFNEQDRRIHFINLPDTATIRIWSLDGDLIREIHHPDPWLSTYSSSVGWDLISRNTQAVVSGIYIWRVDSRLGKQTGKLVIIK